MYQLPTLFLFLLVLFLGIVLDWAVPVAIYRQKFGLFRERPKNFIGCNFWGVVMDVFLAGAINLVVLNYLLSEGGVTNQEAEVAVILGFVAMGLVHVWMAVTFWKEWIMPAPWRWNEGGYYHMFSMTIQLAFCFLPLAVLWDKPVLFYRPETKLLFFCVGIFALLFLGALSVKNKTIKVGPFTVSGEPW